jgi:capsular polysaccharide biosynthesis protein
MAAAPLQKTIGAGEAPFAGGRAGQMAVPAEETAIMTSTKLHEQWRAVLHQVHETGAALVSTEKDGKWIADVLARLPATPRRVLWLARLEVALDDSWLKSMPGQLVIVREYVDTFCVESDDEGVQKHVAGIDLIVADCSQVDRELAADVVVHLLDSGIAALLRLDQGTAPEILDGAGVFDRRGNVDVLDAAGELLPEAPAKLIAEASHFAVLPCPGASEVRAAINANAAFKTGIPMGAEVLAKDDYIRHVEIVTLDTVARMGQFRQVQHSFDRPDFDMYAREYRKENEETGITVCRNVDLIPNPAWKLVFDDKYFVEELGHTHPLSLFGVEHWATYGGIWSIRKQGPLLKLSKHAGPYFLLGGDTNYYHWLLNWVPRLMAFELFSDRGIPDISTVKILVSQTLPVAFRQMLVRLGVPSSNILPLADNVVWRVEELIVPSLFLARRLSPTTAAWYRRKLGTTNDSRNKKRILISRRDASNDRVPRRRLVNEEALLEALRPWGFEAYQLSKLSADEQIELFQQAEFVIGPHGAGFANLVYSPEDTKAIVLENSWNHSFMVDMINVGGGLARAIVCEDVIDAEIEAASPDAIHLKELRRSRDMIANTGEVAAMVAAMLDAKR